MPYGWGTIFYCLFCSNLPNFSAQLHGAPAGYVPTSWMTGDLMMMVWGGLELANSGRPEYLEEAVRRMSGFPAQRLKLWDRGLLRPGMKADVVVFDAEKIADRAEYERPHQYSVGVRHVIVNGKLVLRDEAVTSERPGRVLYGPAHR